MTRLYGRASVNERVIDYVPDVRFSRLSMVSSVRLDGTQIPMIFDGTLTGNLFKGYIEKFLAPSLSKGDIVVMDNLSSHKVAGVIDLIEARGATVLFLPQYSPDLNPIELLWSKVKSFLRKEKAKTYERLIEVIPAALDSITGDDIKAWFQHDGYL